MERDLHKVMASFHYGAWEFLPIVFARKGESVAVATAAQRDPGLAQELDSVRGGSGVTEVRTARDLLGRVSEPGLTGFMLDNTSRGPACRAQVGDVDVRMPGVAFELARRLQTRVVPAFCSVGSRGLEVRVHAAGGHEAAVRALLDEVRACPEEWIFWAKDGALSPSEAA